MVSLYRCFVDGPVVTILKDYGGYIDSVYAGSRLRGGVNVVLFVREIYAVWVGLPPSVC